MLTLTSTHFFLLSFFYTCRCNETGGGCQCKPGYDPETSCQQQCPAGFYGSECQSTCLCQHGSCHHATGECVCSPGYHGRRYVLAHHSQTSCFFPLSCGLASVLLCSVCCPAEKYCGTKFHFFLATQDRKGMCPAGAVFLISCELCNFELFSVDCTA